MKIDAHQHFWLYNEQEYGWINDDMENIRRDFTPEHLQPILINHGYDGTIIVQARQTIEETNWILELAEKNEFVKGIVGWVDLCAPNVEEQLEDYAANPLLKGVRHVLQDEEDSFMLSERFLHGISRLEKYNLTYDILISYKQLPAAIKLVEKLPNQKFVLDHIAKPDIKNSNFHEWKENIERLSMNKNVYCKLSGMVTEADWLHCEQKDFEPFLEIVINAFGVDRVMIGSDWPVCTVSKKYSEVMNIVENYIDSFSKEAQKKILGVNCMEFYQIKD
ncbi:amidohydrolase family protein [Peribacillus sp. NPDC097225]|uniref:amidohydrolase family protein n=1 Tax=Peribacillus sp. NPDC097225 TaxID=3364400 RepID=UPI003819038B